MLVQDEKKNNISAQQFFLMEENEVKLELVHGKVVEMTPVGFRHAAIVAQLIAKLIPFVEANKLGKIVTELGFVLSRNPDIVRAPDIAFICTRHLKIDNQEGFFDGAPDMAIEVLSPTDSISEMVKKTQDYLSGGTSEVYLVDPNTKSVQAHRGSKKIERFEGSEFLRFTGPLRGFEIEINAIFNIF